MFIMSILVFVCFFNFKIDISIENTEIQIEVYGSLCL